MIKPIAIYLSDLDRSLRFSLPNGVAWIEASRETCDIVITSAAFALMLQNGYGYATVDIAGRVIVQNPAFRSLLRRNFIAFTWPYLSRTASVGERFST